MNIEERWYEETAYPIPRTSFSKEEYWRMYRAQLSMGDNLVEVIKELRKLNHDQFQEIGRLQKILVSTKQSEEDS